MVVVIQSVVMSLSFEIKCWKAAHLASVEGGEGFCRGIKGKERMGQEE